MWTIPRFRKKCNKVLDNTGGMISNYVHIPYSLFLLMQYFLNNRAYKQLISICETQAILMYLP